MLKEAAVIRVTENKFMVGLTKERRTKGYKNLEPKPTVSQM